MDFIVKQENPNDVMCESEVVKIFSGAETASLVGQISCQSCAMKDGQIADLKLEKENLILEKDLIQSRHDFELKSLREQNESIHIELEKSKNKCQFMKTQHDVHMNRTTALNDQVDTLKNEIVHLNAKMNREFEVDQLLKHKKQRGKTLYLVRWKGYNKDYDTWEKEENLNCPEILVAYKESSKGK